MILGDCDRIFPKIDLRLKDPPLYVVYSNTKRRVSRGEKREKAIRFSQKRNRRYLLLPDEDGMNRVSTSEILYVEKDRDYLVYHTGFKNFRERGTMKDLKGKLSGLTFSECTSAFW